MKKLIELFKLTLKNLFRKGLRTSLTILGISVGVASVILVMAIGRSGVKLVNNELDSLGLNGITVSSKDSKNKLTTDDLKAVRGIDSVKEAMPILSKTTTVSLNSIVDEAIVWGVDSGAKQVISFETLFGHSINTYNVNSCDNVCLIDESIAIQLFGRSNVVSKNVAINIGGSNENFRIIGVTKTGSGILKSFMGNFIPGFIYIPYTTMQKISGEDTIYQIAVKLKDNDINVEGDSANLTIENIKTAVDLQKGIRNSVKVENLTNQREKLSGILDIIKTVLSGIGTISLLVAGLGIMTVMLVSVNERTKEIGIKKAIGASFSKILTEFILEALTISFLGSIIGCSIGVAASFFGSNALGVTVSISLQDIIKSMSSAIVIGVVFGIYPAYKAAKLQPVVALAND